jgi:hypothetical protein
MSIQQTDGNAVTATSTVNNGGTMVANGTSVALESISTVTAEEGVFGSTVVNNDDADKALSGGVFAHNHPRQPITKRLATELAGVSTNVMQTTGSRPELVRSIHKLETFTSRLQTKAIREGFWDQYSGSFDAGYPLVSGESFDTDVAATPTQDVPGKINYLSGGKYPVSNNYKPRTN